MNEGPDARPGRGELLTSWLVLVVMALVVVVGLALLAVRGGAS
jgi:hypothetical protein